MPLTLDPRISRAAYAAMKRRNPALAPQDLGLTAPEELTAFHEADLRPCVLLEPHPTLSAYLTEAIVPSEELRPRIYRSTRIAATAKLWRGQGGATDGQEKWRLTLRCGSVAAALWNEETLDFRGVTAGDKEPRERRHPYHFLTLPWDRQARQRMVDGLYRLAVNRPDVFSANNPGLTPEELTETARIIAG